MRIRLHARTLVFGGFLAGLSMTTLGASTGGCQPSTPEAEVRAELERYYADFSARDWDAFTDHFWPGATLTAVWRPPGADADSVIVTGVPAFVRRAPEGPGSREVFEERMLDAEIHVTGQLAVAWVRYAARFGDPGDVAEWRGTDAFTLLEHGGRWRISSLAYASDPEGGTAAAAGGGVVGSEGTRGSEPGAGTGEEGPSWLTEHVRTAGSGSKRPPATLEDVGWLAGHWRGEALGGITEEVWAPAAGGSMMGMFRLIREGTTAFYEIQALVEEERSLVLRLKHFDPDLTGWEGREEVVEFPLVRLGDGEAYFDGITFLRVDDATLQVYVALEHADGSVREGDFLYHRVPAREAEAGGEARRRGDERSGDEG